VVKRGDLHWIDFGQRRGSAPAGRRPTLIIQSDSFNDSRIATVLVMVVTSNTALAARPGNVFLPSTITGLPKDSVANVTSVTTVDRTALDPAPIGAVPNYLMSDVERGLRLVMDL
jgi:mRNA interferase MazF